VWKGEYQGRPVAAKVLRVYSTSDFGKIRKVCELVLYILNTHDGELTVTDAEVLQRSGDMEDPSPYKCVTTAGSDDGR